MISKEIRETTDGYSTRYDVFDTSSKKKAVIKIVKYQIYSYKKDGNTYFLLYDNEMNINERVFKFTNFYSKNTYKSVNTKLQYLQSIQLLYSFCELFDKKINELKEEDITMFEYFMLGKSDTNSLETKLYLSNQRTQTTVAKHIANCRIFVKAQRWKNAELFTASQVTKRATKHYKKELPKFITDAEFEQMIDFLDDTEIFSEERKLELECIMRLMFECGLRVGEVLGLTIEDIIEPLEKTKNAFIAIIRNRLSDNKRQKAKTCMNITSKNDYQNPDYLYTKGYGYQTVAGNRELYEDIMDYVNITEKRINRSIRKRKKCYCYADNITKQYKKNRYLFLNERNLSCLSYDALRNDIREIFEGCNIPLDSNSKSSNLCHRFRHGFIMQLLYVKNMPLELAIKYSRHTTVEGLEPYNNPTDEYLISKINEMNTKYIYNREKIKEVVKGDNKNEYYENNVSKI